MLLVRATAHHLYAFLSKEAKQHMLYSIFIHVQNALILSETCGIML